MKCKPDLIANVWQVACTKGAWLCMDDQAGRIYLAPMVAAYDSFLKRDCYALLFTGLLLQ